MGRVQFLENHHSVCPVCHCLDLDFEVFCYQLPQSHRVGCSLKFQVRDRLLLHWGNPALPNNDRQVHSIITLGSLVNHHTYCFQRGIVEGLQIFFLVTFVKLASLHRHGFRFRYFCDSIEELLFAFFLHSVIPLLPTFRPDCLQKDAHSHRKRCIEPQVVKH